MHRSSGQLEQITVRIPIAELLDWKAMIIIIIIIVVLLARRERYRTHHKYDMSS